MDGWDEGVSGGEGRGEGEGLGIERISGGDGRRG